MRTGDFASGPDDPARPIVEAIARLVPEARWSYATVLASGEPFRPVASPDSRVTLERLGRELKLQRLKVKIGPRIAAAAGPLESDESAIAMVFADARTTYGILMLVRPAVAGLFTSAEVAMLTFALDSASDRLAAVRSDLEARVLKADPVERSVAYRAPILPEGAMYVLDLELKILLSWSSEGQRGVASSGLRTQPADRLPSVLERCVRTLTAGWAVDALMPSGTAHPLPFLTLRATPLSGDAGIFVGVRIDRLRPSNSLAEATARYKISPREGQVLALLLDGHHLAEMARLLGISSSTVQDHIKSMTNKTGSRNRSELISHVLGWDFAEREP